MSATSGRSFRLPSLVLAASPAGMILFLILRYAVNFHYWDEWSEDIAGLFVKGFGHQITFADLVAKHNEHRILIPRLILLAINPITHWNNIANQVVAWLIVCATSLLILRLIHRTHPPGHPLVLWFLCNVMIFTPAQWENWLWGMSLENFSPAFFIFAAFVVALSKWEFRVRLILCILLAAAATYSSGNGILAWPLVGALLAWSQSRPEWTAKIKWMVLWIVATAVIILLYRIQIPGAPDNTGKWDTFNRDQILPYNLAFMGNAFAYAADWNWKISSMGCGSVMLLLLAAVTVHFFYLWRLGRVEVCRRMLPWLMVAGYGIFSGLIASFYRAGAGAPQALQSRYVSFSLYLPVGLILLLPMSGEELRKTFSRHFSRVWSAAPALAAILLLLIQCSTLSHAFENFREVHMQFRRGKGTLLLLMVAPRNPQRAELGLPDDPQAFANAKALSEHGYIDPPLILSRNANLILRVNDDTEADVLGYMEHIRTMADGHSLATGWAVYPNTGHVADSVFLTYENAQHESIIFAAARMLGVRQDVAASLGNPNFAWCGWEAEFQSQQIDPNLEETKITAWSLDVDTGKATKLDGILPFHR